MRPTPEKWIDERKDECPAPPRWYPLIGPDVNLDWKKNENF
jgi:hypothetical protein